MRVIEQFLCGKANNEDLNEDRIAVGENFIGLMDGATNRAGSMLAGRTLGRFAAETVAAALHDLPADIGAREAVDALSQALRARTEEVAAAEGADFAHDWSAPATAVLIYSRQRQEIWRVADSSFVVDGGAAHMRFFAQEKIWCDLRRAWLQAQLVRGRTVEDLLQNDQSWQLLTPLIGELKVFANSDHAMAHPYGFGVINGARVPDRYIEVFDASGARELAFASDGYPEVLPTLDDTEQALARTLAADPLMYRLHPQVKGLRPGWVSYDDRSYIRFSV
jgi:glycerophosphoryl diester phosphodiesterase